MAQVGRISGPLLFANLERNGNDLAFRDTLDTTQLLYLNVNDGKIGVNTDTPINTLDVAGTMRVPNIIHTTAKTSNLDFNNSSISTLSGPINLNAGTNIKLSTFQTDNIQINDNTISTYRSNADLELRPWRDYELVNGDPYMAELIAGLQAASSNGSHAYKAFWEVVLPSGFQRGDVNESGSIDIDDVMGFLSVARGISTSGGTYDRSIAAIEASLPKLEVKSNLNVNGAINATGDITMDGNIVIGDDINEDTIDFNADVNSNIIPATDNTYSLGTPTKKWQELFSVLLNGSSVVTGNVNLAGIDPYSLRPGNTFFVSVNGDDTNVGDHPNGAFATVKKALDFADASAAGPVNIVIYPGEYQEELPLTVPANVNISGMDMRNTIIMPDTSSQSEDVFLVNGETNISNLTIKDFYYDSGNDKGYAFKFAPNTVVSSRSPYMQNCTVITKGTTTSASDPRGFASGDAGKGALIDGASVDSASQEASMLFHSCTFITPGVDAITMTNGVRVEWLNSFTYFANIGLHAKNGSTGHLSTDGSTIQYGAEIRSIGSASVYGNKGAVADGDETLMYLIQHNMAYIGAGKFVDNDPSRAIQANETEELNSGKIYFQTIDHLGNFRVGEQFEVNQEDGTTSITISEADVNSLGGLTISTNGATTVVNGERVETGNIKLSGNTISSTSGDINVNSSANINFLKNTNITNNKNIDISGNITIGGSAIRIGDETTDTIDFNTNFSQNIEPDIAGAFDLGTLTKKWNNGYFNEANISDIKFEGNVVTTTESNADLELYANGTGRIYIENNDAQIDNNIEVGTVTTLANTTISGTVTHVGDYNQTGDRNITGDLTVTQDLSVTGKAQFEEVLIDDNYITTTTSNADLALQASGTGNVVLQNYVDFSNLISTSATLGNNLGVETQASAQTFDNGDIQIFDNVITTTLSNSDLDLRSNADSEVMFEDIRLDDSKISSTDGYSITIDNNNVLITGTGSLQVPIGTTGERTTNQGDLRYNTTLGVYEGYNGSANITFAGVFSDDLQTSLTADKFSNNIRMIIGSNETQEIDSTKLMGEFTGSGVTLQRLDIDDVRVDGNTISTTVSNSNLELFPNGTGEVVIDDIRFEDNKIKNNTASGLNLVFSNTGVGYVKFAGTGAIAVPYGKTDQQPEDSTPPPTGDTRWNTDTQLLETWDGNTYITSAGTATAISEAEFNDLLFEYTIALG